MDRKKEIMVRPKRFYYHYDRHGEKNMIIHFKGRNRKVAHIECYVPCGTKWRETQPRLVMEGFCSRVNIVKLDGEKVGIIQ